MPCLRTRFNCSAVYLGDNEGLVGRSLVEGKIRVKTRSGKREYLWFDGFIGKDELPEGITQVRLLDIEAYIFDYAKSSWVEIGQNAECLGVLMTDNTVKCTLQDDFPITWCEFSIK